MTASCARVIGSSGAKVLGLMPETTPVSFAHQMASVYQRPRSTSSNGGASFLSS